MASQVFFVLFFIVVLTFTVGSVVTSCTQTSSPYGETTTTSTSSTTTSTISSDISFSSDVQPIFNDNCTSCHGSSGGMNLASSVSYSNLVNVASEGYAPNLRVKPSDEANSVLVKKLEGASGFGDRMPRGGAALSSDLIQKIKNWINQGAKNN